MQKRPLFIWKQNFWCKNETGTTIKDPIKRNCTKENVDLYLFVGNSEEQKLYVQYL